MPETQEPRVVSVERVERQIGRFRCVGTVTRVWDPEAAARIREAIIQSILAKIPQLLTQQPDDGSAADDDQE